MLFLFYPLTAAASTAEVDGKKFDQSLTIGDKDLKLVGAGLLRYFGFKAYVGAFYMEQGYDIDDALSDTAKRIEIEYLRHLHFFAFLNGRIFLDTDGNCCSDFLLSFQSVFPD